MRMIRDSKQLFLCYNLTTEAKCDMKYEGTSAGERIKAMKKNSKRISFILLGIALLISLGFWLIACLFACGQLYDTYDLWVYISDAPIAVAIIIALFAGAVASFVAAIRAKDKQ